MRLRPIFIAVCLAAAAVAHATQPVTNAPATETWTSGPYVYDGAGNITKIGTNAYAYDSAKRVRQYLPEAGGSQTFSYDSFGNMKRIEQVLPAGGTPITRVIPIESSSNQVGPSGGSVYDRAGNMLSHSGDVYTYDSQNMMIRLEGTGKKFAYVYSPDDERIGTVNLLTKQWVWTTRSEDGRVLREYTSSGGTTGAGAWVWSRDYVYRGSSLLASEGVEGTRHYHLDHLGSPRLVTNGTSVKTAFHTYMPFGEEETSIRQDRERLRFTGHERDFNGGTFDENKDYLDYMHARYYNPTLARFMSIDPVLDMQSAMRSPQSWNRYSYVLNNPVRNTDPTGREVVIQGGSPQEKQDMVESLKVLVYDQKAAQFLTTDEFSRLTVRGMSVEDWGKKFGGNAGKLAELMLTSYKVGVGFSEDEMTVKKGGGGWARVSDYYSQVTLARSQFHQKLGGVMQWIDTTLAHELFGHAMMDAGLIKRDVGTLNRFKGFPLVADETDPAGMWAENEYRKLIGDPLRPYYITPGDYAPPKQP